MSNNNRNDEGVAIAMIIGFIGAAVLVVAALFAVFFLFLAFALTIAAIFAWNKPRRFGKFILTPEEARGFVHRGLAGAVLIPLFIALLDIFLNLHVNWNFLFHFMLAGYVLGSIGVEVMMAEENGGQSHHIPDHTQLPAPRQEVLPPPAKPAGPFRYASWDDEEERG